MQSCKPPSQPVAECRDVERGICIGFLQRASSAIFNHEDMTTGVVLVNFWHGDHRAWIKQRRQGCHGLVLKVHAIDWEGQAWRYLDIRLCMLDDDCFPGCFEQAPYEVCGAACEKL